MSNVEARQNEVRLTGIAIKEVQEKSNIGHPSCRCCKIQSFCVLVKCDLSMTLSPDKSFFVSSAEEFLSEIQPSIMRPRFLIGLE